MRTNASGSTNDVRNVLESILTRNSGRWFRYIAAILKNDADAEDVIQEAVRRVLERNRRLPSQEEAKMYLGRAIGNSALELYHSRKRERLRETPIKDYICLRASTQCPYTYLEEREANIIKEKMLGLLHEGLANLPLEQHEALRLTILESEGLSIRDVGASSGIPYSTLRHRSKAGLRRLRRFLVRSIREEDGKKREKESGRKN
jgi:RNA polymerase sigma-70 factor (ECF subfamily)